MIYYLKARLLMLTKSDGDICVILPFRYTYEISKNALRLCFTLCRSEVKQITFSSEARAA